MAIYSNIDYYLDLFQGLRDKINYLVHRSGNFHSISGFPIDDLKLFSLMVMVSSDKGESYRWLLLEDQKQFVIRVLKDEKFYLSETVRIRTIPQNTYKQLLDRLGISAEDYFKNWIKFELKESGFIKYFLNTKKNTEFIQDFSEEKYLIEQGYDRDYGKQQLFDDLRNDYCSKLGVKRSLFDPFTTLESIWGFKGVPFYYIKLPKLKSLEFVAIFPMIQKERESFFEKADFIFSLVKNAVLGANLMKGIIDKNIDEIRKQYLKTAIISILIDSYAHNISAHSLAALKWWIELRHKTLDKRFEIKNGSEINCLQPASIIFNKIKKEYECKVSSPIRINQTSETTLKYYEALGLKDSTYNQDYYSLFDFLQFADQEVVKNLFKFENVFNHSFHPRFPVPIDYALYPFFRFLRDKGAFWSGVTRDMAFGGESKTWYKILWEDFANNPLYLGTIAKSEGITKININLKVKTKEGHWIQGKFVTIDMSVIEYEERLSQNPNLTIEYDENDYKLFNEYLEDEKLKVLIIGFRNNKNVIDETISINELKNIETKGRAEIRSNNNSLLEKLDYMLNKILLTITDDGDIICKDKTDNLFKEKCEHSENKFVKAENYSKYSFIRLGKCFSHFREVLDDEENFRVFLPGGIVGEHALFTIFENTIRNIKHYKDEKTLEDIKKNGIDFWISIEEDKLWITKQNEIKEKSESITEEIKKSKEGKKPELFKVGVWLGHETKLITKEETEVVDANGKKETRPAEYLLFIISDNTLKPILDESTGSPRMGGNSQDKACAAMLFNNKFSSVENRGDKSTDGKINERDKEYFPWIEFKTLKLNEKNDAEIKLEWKDGQKVISEVSKNNYSDSISKKDEGYLKKYFYLWRGEDVLDKSALEADDWENPARAKFLVNDNKWNDEDIIKARKNGIIRLLDYTTKPKNIDEFNKSYINWLYKWKTNNKNYELDFCSDTDFMLGIKINNEDFILLNDENDSTNKRKLYLSHGGEESYHCNVRSHGSFWNKFFDESVWNKDPKNLDQFIDEFSYWVADKQKKKKSLMLELLEAVFTRVVIFDNRIALRIPKAYYNTNDNINGNPINKVKMLEKELSLSIFKEDKNELNVWLNKENSYNHNANFLIIHLSFIESIADNSGHNYSEDTLDKFIEEKLDNFIYCKENNEKKLRDDFILVITSGRGRDKWRDSLKNKDTKYEKFTIFKPVESLLSAVEQGISYNDHFDIKYNLIKVLFGN